MSFGAGSSLPQKQEAPSCFHLVAEYHFSRVRDKNMLPLVRPPTSSSNHPIAVRAREALLE